MGFFSIIFHFSFCEVHFIISSVVAMVSRKKAAGKARKAAKAKAREAAEERNNNREVNDELEQSLAAQASRPYLTAPAPIIQPVPCHHGIHLLYEGVPYQFARAFTKSFYEATRAGRPFGLCLVDAKNATMAMDEFADVWNDSAKMKMVIAELLAFGTRGLLEGRYNHARAIATFARYLEQYIAVELEQTQAFICWPKVEETYDADEHTLVEFLRRRISCSCLDEKYEEVKSISKIGICYNPDCKHPNRMTERSNTMYCSRCRCAVYCSRECQIADLSRHKIDCDQAVMATAEFEAKKES